MSLNFGEFTLEEDAQDEAGKMTSKRNRGYFAKYGKHKQNNKPQHTLSNTPTIEEENVGKIQLR